MRALPSIVVRILLVGAAIGVFAPRAQAITLREIIELTQAGLSEEVLLALIEVDQRVFPVDPETLKALKEGGVSPRVIVAVVKSGRMPQPQVEPVVAAASPEPRPDPPAPQVVVIDRPVVHEVPVAVAVPVYVAVGSRSRVRHREEPYVVPPTPFAPFGSRAVPTAERVEQKRQEPVYWGWGGKLRPDAWQPK
jgi:hypothetical protein